jgi:hypothetical protein
MGLFIASMHEGHKAYLIKNKVGSDTPLPPLHLNPAVLSTTHTQFHTEKEGHEGHKAYLIKNKVVPILLCIFFISVCSFFFPPFMLEVIFICHVFFINGFQYMCIIPFSTLLLFKTGWPNPEKVLCGKRQCCRR